MYLSFPSCYMSHPPHSHSFNYPTYI
jgi:hypothetical protein